MTYHMVTIGLILQFIRLKRGIRPSLEDFGHRDGAQQNPSLV